MNLILLAPRLVHHAREVEPRVGEGAWAEPEPWAAGLRKRAEAPSSPTFPAPTGSKARSSAKVPRWSGGAWENDGRATACLPEFAEPLTGEK